MNSEEVLAKIPPGGFIKLTKSDRSGMSDAQRIALNRKGNEFFNAGHIEQAKKIFLTTGYSDGIIRLGNLYLDREEPLEAYRMYWLAPAPGKVASMTEKMAAIVQQWIHEDAGNK